MTATTNGTYNVIIASLQEGADRASAAEVLAAAIGLEAQVAEVILRKAPIALFRDLAQDEIDFLREHLVDLSRAGLDFRITQRESDDLPKVNWPAKPDVRVLFSDEYEDEEDEEEEVISAPAAAPGRNGSHAPAPAPPAAKAGKDTAKIPPAPGKTEVDFSCPCCQAVLKVVKDANKTDVSIIAGPRINPLADDGPVARSTPAGAPAPAPPPGVAPRPKPQLEVRSSLADNELLTSPMDMPDPPRPRLGRREEGNLAGGSLYCDDDRNGSSQPAEVVESPFEVHNPQVHHSFDADEDVADFHALDAASVEEVAEVDEVEEVETFDAVADAYAEDFDDAMQEADSFAAGGLTDSAFEDELPDGVAEEFVDDDLMDDYDDDGPTAPPPPPPTAPVYSQASYGADELLDNDPGLTEVEVESDFEDVEEVEAFDDGIEEVAVDDVQDFDDPGGEDDGLEPWKGPARTHAEPPPSDPQMAAIAAEPVEEFQNFDDIEEVSDLVDDDDEDDDGLEPWTGSARKHAEPPPSQPALESLKISEPSEVELEFDQDEVSAARAGAAAVQDDDEEEDDGLQPWTGRARDYVDPLLKKEPQKQQPVNSARSMPKAAAPAPAAPARAAAAPAKPAAAPAKAAAAPAKAAAAPAKPITKKTKKSAAPPPDAIPVDEDMDLDLGGDELLEVEDVDVPASTKRPSSRLDKASSKSGKISKRRKKSRKTSRIRKDASDEELLDGDVDLGLVEEEEDIAETLNLDFDSLPAGDGLGDDDDDSLDAAELSLDDDEVDLGADAAIDLEDDLGVSAADLDEDGDIDLSDDLDDDLPEPDADANGGNCTVFLNKIKPAEKEKAINLIMELGGITKGDATKLSGRLVIPVLKDVTEQAAEDALAKFRKAGLSGRIRKG